MPEHRRHKHREKSSSECSERSERSEQRHKHSSEKSKQSNSQERVYKNGRNGFNGRNGIDGKRGKRGRDGKRGKRGHCGAPGISGGADFYVLMPSGTVASGNDVAFPQDGVNTDANVTRVSDHTFNVADIGTYLIQFQVNVSGPGQLCIAMNGVEEPLTVVGSATQLIGNCLIQTVTDNTIFSIRNPGSAFTISGVSARLLFLQIA